MNDNGTALAMLPVSGRPRKHDRAKVMRAVCQRMASGELVKDAAKAEGVDASTVRRWALEKPFRAMYARARESQAEALAEQAIDIANGLDGYAALVLRAVDEEAPELPPDVRRALLNSAQSNIVQRDRLRVDTLKWHAMKLAPRLFGASKLLEEARAAGKTLDEYVRDLAHAEAEGKARDATDVRVVEAYLLARDKRRQLQRELREDERIETNRPRHIRVIEEVSAGRLTPHERRAAHTRELATFARDAGMPDVAEQLEQLARRLAEPHPVDRNGFTFEINGDGPSAVAVLPYNGRDPIAATHEIVIAREPRGADGSPRAHVPSVAPSPAPDVRPPGFGGLESHPTSEPLDADIPIDPARARMRQKSSFGVA